ncbi:MAG TPA: hypothetical protein ENI34_00385 [candidate division WOR-3 bacterium]|uniref:Uncharacterized protein n=1 Tax=candidate division WOR-3 bacterium TaxID=2052148 RepID=A0A9C9EKE1_UNCW3|nr:hypothetical protein [candidate division WOR-3 bacterium]
MKTTYFKPSIHGWPFANRWRKGVCFEIYGYCQNISMGFCGGMCWTALDRFYRAIPIFRDLQRPQQGDSLYKEIWNAQKRSASPDALWNIFDQQRSSNSKQGKNTQKEWNKIKRKLDVFKPVTITLIAHANDLNPFDIKDSHRVVAYAYDIGAPDRQAPAGADQKVTLWIYDPNLPDNDDVRLTFYLGSRNNEIKLRHNFGYIYDFKFHGFFMDDKNRVYSHSEATQIQIDPSQRLRILSATLVNYDLKFSWRCRFVPYFNIIIDDDAWLNNRQLQSQYLPDRGKVDKQCPSRNGSMSIPLKLIRKVSIIKVQLLGDDNYTQSIEIDAKPVIKCYPYVHQRACGDLPEVCDSQLGDQDLYIKNENPSNSEIRQLDTSEFRWVFVTPPARDLRRSENPQDDLTTAYVEIIEKKQLGNIISPIFANFEERNLAPPTTKSGLVKVYQNNRLVYALSLNSLRNNGQKLFNGFQNNPTDYDHDTWVKFTFQAKDKYGLIVRGKTIFYGKSIILQCKTAEIHVFDPNKFRMLEAVVMELIEKQLLDLKIGITSRRPFPRPQPIAADSLKVLRKIHKHRRLQEILNKTFRSIWTNRRTWQQIWAAQSKIIKRSAEDEIIYLEGKYKKGRLMKLTRELQMSQQGKFNLCVVNIVTTKVLNKLRRDRNFMKMLKLL